MTASCFDLQPQVTAGDRGVCGGVQGYLGKVSMDAVLK